MSHVSFTVSLNEAEHKGVNTKGFKLAHKMCLLSQSAKVNSLACQWLLVMRCHPLILVLSPLAAQRSHQYKSLLSRHTVPNGEMTFQLQ